MPRRLLTVKAAAAVLVAALSVGGVAAAAGVFPAPARPAADRGPDGPGRGATATTRPSHSATTADGNAADREHGNGTATGPDATGPAKDGLCRAWQAGQGGDHGKREDSPAFRALAAAAGGADKVAAYCQTTTPGGSAGQGQRQGQGPPPSGGSGRGSGGPPTTG